MTSRFDRVRPRIGAAVPAPAAGRADAPGGGSLADAEGKRALFSPTTEPAPAAGSVTLDCPGCGQRSAITLRQAVRAAVPSLHLPLLRKHNPSWMRCPACGRRGWVSVRVHL